jgi:hypothetical protein
MNQRNPGRPSWSTSCFGASPRSAAQDLRTLREHLHACRASHGRLFALQCAAESLDGFLSPRFATTVALGLLLVGLSSMLA